MTPAIVASESRRNADDLRKLYDELQEDIATRKYMIASDVAEFLDKVSRWFERKPTQDLTGDWKLILHNIRLAKEKAMVHVSLISVQLDTVSKSIQELHGNNIVEPSRAAELQMQLEEIKETLGIYEMTQEIDLSADIPKYVLSFGLPSSILTTHDFATTPHCSSESSPSILDTNIIAVDPIASLPIAKQPEQKNEYATLKGSCSFSSSPSSDSHSSVWRSHKIDASYNVDVLATDRVNVFYTSYFEDRPDLIAYCRLDDRRDADLSCNWDHSRILDIVWWDRVSAFVCATNDAIYTVTIQNDKFKIETKVKGAWSHVRMATNSDRLWLWSKTNTFYGILVYEDDFKLDRTIDLADGHIRHFVSGSSSFCLTDKLVASIYKQTEKNRKRLQVHFNDFNMINFKTVRLGPFDGDAMIRTDGENHYYITTGGKKIHMVSSEGNKESFDLSNDSDALAVVNSQCVVVSGRRRTMEVLTR